MDESVPKCLLFCVPSRLALTMPFSSFYLFYSFVSERR